MEIILLEDVEGLGYKNDVVKVRDGYGRNYLIPRKVGALATETNKKIVAENQKQAAHKAEKLKTAALNIAEQMGELILSVSTKAGESGKIFGAITTNQISEALKARGFEVDRKKIAFKTDIKALGNYTATLDLHREVKKEITIAVVSE